jgi:hypothetical protein
METRKPRKRRWDVANVLNDNDEIILAAECKSSCLVGASADVQQMKRTAAEIAAKIAPPCNTGANTRGKHSEFVAIPPPKAGRPFIDICINNAPDKQRTQLTKRLTLDKLETCYNVSISIKGRYIPQSELVSGQSDNDRPLYLRVKSPMEDPKERENALDQVVAVIKNMLQVPSSADHSSTPLVRRLYFGKIAENVDFDAGSRMRGPNGSYVDYIVKKTGIQACEVRGGGEDLCIFLLADHQSKLHAAER